MFRKELAQIGLNSGEAKLYACLLQKGDLSASEIAKETGLGRTNVYEYATSLKKKNLIADFERKRKTYFRAEHPNQISSIIQKQIATAKQNEILFNELFPRLEKSYQNNCGMPTMHRLIGDSGYNEFCDSIYLKGSNTDIYIYIRNLDKFEPAHPKYRNKISSRGLHTYLFACKGDDFAEFSKRDERENRTTILKDICFDIDVAVAEDRVYIGNIYSKKFAVTVISNLQFAEFLRNLLKSLL